MRHDENIFLTQKQGPMKSESQQEHHPAVATLNARLTMIHQDVGEMKNVLREMTTAITKLALVEQAQAQSVKVQERVTTALDKLEARVAEIERRMPDVARTSVWVDRALWAVAAAALMYVAKKTGLLL